MCKVLQQPLGWWLTKHCSVNVLLGNDVQDMESQIWMGESKELPGFPISVTSGMFLRRAQSQEPDQDIAFVNKKLKPLLWSECLI